MNDSELYGKVAPTKLFFQVAIPGAISMIASSLWGLFDGIFVGNLLGEGAFAALNLAFPFVLLNFSLADLIGVGSAVRVSVFLGRNDRERANNCFTCACLMILAVSIIMGAVIFFSAPFLLEFMGADTKLTEMGTQYLQVYALASPLTTMIFAVDNFLRICGKIKTSWFLRWRLSFLVDYEKHSLLLNNATPSTSRYDQWTVLFYRYRCGLRHRIGPVRAVVDIGKLIGQICDICTDIHIADIEGICHNQLFP